MDRLTHGYTNATRRLPDGRVEKWFSASARERALIEAGCLTQLAGVLPVPTLISCDRDLGVLVMDEAHGRHGQELIEDGHATDVLELVGRTLRVLQQVSVETVPGLPGQGPVIAHGDFGPQNMLLDLGRGTVTALLDWEFAHRGNAVEDLAWAEWIVRMHHPMATEKLPALFSSAGITASWSTRQDAMVLRCEQLRLLCEANHDSAGSDVWRTRAATTARWSE
jgi:aminoglycoside phosphotransferase